MLKAIIPKGNQFSVEIIVNENTTANKLINVNKDGHIGLAKDH